MPVYGTIANPPSIYPGEQQTLVNNAANDANVTQTQQVAVPQDATDPTASLMLVNTTNQTAKVAAAASDAAANYQPLTNADTNNAITVAAGSAIRFSAKACPFLCATFAVAPTSGSLVLCR